MKLGHKLVSRVSEIFGFQCWTCFLPSTKCIENPSLEFDFFFSK